MCEKKPCAPRFKCDNLERAVRFSLLVYKDILDGYKSYRSLMESASNYFYFPFLVRDVSHLADDIGWSWFKYGDIPAYVWVDSVIEFFGNDVYVCMPPATAIEDDFLEWLKKGNHACVTKKEIDSSGVHIEAQCVKYVPKIKFTIEK